MISLLYFAWVRERIGRDSEVIALPDGVADPAGLLAALGARGAEYRAAFAEPDRLRFAVNQVFAGPTAPIRDGDEIAVFPPVTGG